MSHIGVITPDPTTGTSVHRLLSESQHRKRLTIYAPGNDTVTISNNPTVSANQGITLIPGMAPLYFDIDYHGDCLRREWYGIYSGGTGGASWIETLCYGEDHNHAHDTYAGRRQ